MGRESRSGCSAWAINNVDYSRRNPCLKAEFATPQWRQWRLLSRLQYDCTTSGQSGSNFPDRHAEWAVPRVDRANNADRLLQRERKYLARLRIGDCVAVDRGGLTSVISEETHRPPFARPCC